LSEGDEEVKTNPETKKSQSAEKAGRGAVDLEKGGIERIHDTYRALGISTVAEAPFCGAEEFGIMVGYKTGLYSNHVLIMSAGTEE